MTRSEFLIRIKHLVTITLIESACQRGIFIKDIKNQLLKFDKCGFFFTEIDLDNEIKQFVENEDYGSIDEYFKSQTLKNGIIFQELQKYSSFESIEFIISLRDSKNPWEEDGIWHDDGSRKLAFSLSILDACHIEGGTLEIRNKITKEYYKIKPFNFGRMIVFKTGLQNFEHKINAVTNGKRLIIAGWCS